MYYRHHLPAYLMPVIKALLILDNTGTETLNQISSGKESITFEIIKFAELSKMKYELLTTIIVASEFSY